MCTAVVAQYGPFPCIPTLLYVCLVLATRNKSGVAQWLACWAHNLKFRGSKPRSAIFRQAGAPSLRSSSPSLCRLHSLYLNLCPACCGGVITPHHVRWPCIVFLHTGPSYVYMPGAFGWQTMGLQRLCLQRQCSQLISISQL